MIIFTTLLILLGSALLLVKAADILVTNAEKLGLSLKVPPFLVGVIILSIGTSLPELSAGISATLKGHSELVTADIMGSNIANIFLGLGAVAFLTRRHITFKQNVFEVHFPILVMSVFAFVISIWDRVVTAGEGFIFLIILLAYLWFLLAKHQHPSMEKKECSFELNNQVVKKTGIINQFQLLKSFRYNLLPHSRKKHQHEPIIPFVWRYPIKILLGGIGLAVSAHFLVESLIKTASLFGLAESVLAASLVSISTSLPEMVVGFKAAKKGNYDALVGNILGSNIFNILLIVSITSFITPLKVSDEAIYLLLPFFVGSIFIYWVSKKDKQITMQEGAAMTILYCLYLGKLYGLV